MNAYDYDSPSYSALVIIGLKAYIIKYDILQNFIDFKPRVDMPQNNATETEKDILDNSNKLSNDSDSKEKTPMCLVCLCITFVKIRDFIGVIFIIFIFLYEFFSHRSTSWVDTTK